VLGKEEANKEQHLHVVGGPVNMRSSSPLFLQNEPQKDPQPPIPGLLKLTKQSSELLSTQKNALHTMIQKKNVTLLHAFKKIEEKGVIFDISRDDQNLAIIPFCDSYDVLKKPTSGKIQIYNLLKLDSSPLQLTTQIGSSILFSSDPSQFACSSANKISLYQIKSTSIQLRSSFQANSADVLSFQFNKEGSKIFSLGTDKKLCI